jgi:ElaB/YqjD/DUF883 family membrane-anchored ribosome-binding protein
MMEPFMARDSTSPALAADIDALVAQLASLREDVSGLATLVGATASRNSKAMADTIGAGVHDAREALGHKAHDADARFGYAVATNPYIAIGLAAGLGLVLGALTARR